MPPLDFPANPVDGQLYQDFIYDATVGVWRAQASGGGFPISVANGGTGATTVADAQDSLRVGLVPIDVPTVVATGGTASETGLGQITFTTCTDIRLQGAFTSDFRHYRIYFDLSTASATTAAGLRAVKGSSPITTANYLYGGEYRDVIGTGGAASGESKDKIIMGDYFSNGPRFTSVIDVLHPQASGKNAAFMISSMGVRSDGGSRTYHVIGEYSTSDNYDGILFMAYSGNFSGTIQVFGLNI